MSNPVKMLKRIIIKEEFVILTGDFRKAIILNQFLYWQERVNDFDKFIEEEKNRAKNEGMDINMPAQNGWIYKTAEELSEETMLGLSPQTMRRIIKELVENGWLLERNNLLYKWDKTTQYRINFPKLIKDLNDLGFHLDGYKLVDEIGEVEKTCNPRDCSFSKMDVRDSKMEVRDSKMEVRDSKMEVRDSKMEAPNSKMENRVVKNGGAIPEITTEITTENIYNQSVSHISNISNIREKIGNSDGRTDGFSFDMRRWEFIKEQICLSDFDPEDQVIIETAIIGLLTGEYDYKKPREVIYSILEKLDALSVERALVSYRKIDFRKKITNPIRYFQQCLLNSQAEEVLEKKRFALQFSGP